MNDKEREVVLKTAELINKERKDLEISNNYLEAQLKNKKNLLDELLAKVAAAQKTFSNLVGYPFASPEKSAIPSIHKPQATRIMPLNIKRT